MTRALAFFLLAACSSEPDPPPPALDCGDGEVGKHEECDDGNEVNGDGCSRCNLDSMVTVMWRFYPTVGGEPLPNGCLPGVETVELVNELSMTASYPCAAHRYGTVPITSREGGVIARLRDGNGEIVSESWPRGGDMYSTAYVDFYADGGWVRALLDAECIEMAVMTLVPVGGGTSIVSGRYCEGELSSIVFSAPAKAGVYDVTLTTQNFERTITGVTVQPNSAVTDLEVR